MLYCNTFFVENLCIYFTYVAAPDILVTKVRVAEEVEHTLDIHGEMAYDEGVL